MALPLFCTAQIVLVGLPHSTQKAKAAANARTKALELPIWEDFSSTKTTAPNTDLWYGSTTVRVNDGLAIRPPSIKVATFDGVDSTGRPYNGTDVLAKGYADKLESQTIDLTTIDVSERSSVYLSFAYQMRGRGETPDIGDRLLVSFRDTSAWVPVDTIESSTSLLPDRFYTAIIPVSNVRFYHPEFRFRIQNFSRLSGPYDTWNVDYIYLDKGRTANDVSFPDRTISEPPTSLLGKYRMVPLKHFRKDSTKTPPTVLATNLLDFVPYTTPPSQSKQTFNISTSVQISYRANGVVTDRPFTQLDFQDTSKLFLQKDIYTELSGEVIANVVPKTPGVDSVGVVYKFNIDAGDNNIIDPDGDGIFKPNGDRDIDEGEGDYDPAKWSPINFKTNDTTSVSFLLLNKYAYDDGVAEYGAGLNQPGAQLAYEYNLVGAVKDTITHLEVYFPRFGDESSQLIDLRIWTDLTKDPVYTEITTLQRSQQNAFWVKKLLPAIIVGEKFYIGWRQSSSAVIAAGLDKNTDSGDRMFYNTDGTWVANTLIRGSLMLRPVFGGNGVVTGLEDEKKSLVVYPNPSTGTFRFEGIADHITVYDITGRTTAFHVESTAGETIVTLPNSSYGIYILKAYVEGEVRTAKLLVR